MLTKYRIKKTGAMVFVVTLLVFLAAIKISQSGDIRMNLQAWENVHQWRAQGECADCHTDHEHVKQPVDFAKTLPIPPPSSHTQTFLRFSHARENNASAHQCQSCHQADSCRACHNIMPGSHSADFVSPTGESLGSLQHALLARTNTSACLTCHQESNKSCTSCHAISEVTSWKQDSAESLSHWKPFLGF